MGAGGHRIGADCRAKSDLCLVMRYLTNQSSTASESLSRERALEASAARPRKLSPLRGACRPWKTVLGVRQPPS